MSSAASLQISALSVAAARRIDAACDCLEEALQAGRPWDWQDYRGTVEESEQPALLRQLLLLEWEYRHNRGDPLDLTDYLARFPEHATLIRQASEEHTIETGRAIDAAPAALSAAAQQGWQALGYTIISPLGRGGMGTVYLACQTAADRLVALKMLHHAPENDGASLDRFRREARTLARLQHPHIVPVFEVGENQGRPFYSMEYCPGGSLAEHLRQTRLTPHESAALLETLARAAHAAHQAGIIHRDLKPSNVLLSVVSRQLSVATDHGPLTTDLIPKLADFGLAKNVDATAQTQTGAVLGTPQYMAPEQARGESKAVGAAADVYALGAILYECLTGRPPFLGATLLDTMLQVISDDAEPPTRFHPKLPRDLETICLKCLQKDPQRRYADAVALAEDLRRFRAGEPILARPVGASERTWSWARRHPAAASLLGVLMLSSAVAVALAAWALGERDHALAAQRAADDHQRRAERHAVVTLYEQALSVAEHEGAAGVLLRLAGILKQAVDEKATDLEESIRSQFGLWSRDVRHLRSVFIGHEGNVFAVAMSPDGSMVLTGSADRTAQLWNAATGERIGPPLEHLDTVFAVAFSPDGSMVLTGSADHSAQLWNAATGQRVGARLEHQNRVLAVAFSPDGKLLLTGSHDKTAQLWETGTGQPLVTLEHPDIVRAVAFSPDGNTILTGCDDKVARMWETATAKPVGPLVQHQDQVFAVAFSPDGKRILTGSQDKTAQLWNAATGQRVGPPLEHLKTIFGVAFSPDGKTILTSSDDRTARLWEASTGMALGSMQHAREIRAAAFSPDGKTVLTGSCERVARLWDVALPTIIKHQDAVTAVAFSPNGKTVLTGSCETRAHAQLWDAVTGGPVGPALQHGSWVKCVAFSPDGKMVLTGGYNHKARLWDAATGRPLGSPLEHRDRVWAVAFSPDGKTVLTGSTDRSAQLWDVATGNRLGLPLQHDSTVASVAFAPDGKKVLTGSWDKVARLWDAATGEVLVAFPAHRWPVTVVGFSPDGKTILTGSEDKTAQLWDAATLQPVCTPLLHGGAVCAVAFSPDGKRVLTGSEDNLAMLWETATGRLLGPPWQHQGHVAAVAFSPDGKKALTGSSDRTACLWEIIPPIEGGPEQIMLWTQVVTGMELDEQGRLRALDAATWSKHNQQLDQLGGIPLSRP